MTYAIEIEDAEHCIEAAEYFLAVTACSDDTPERVDRDAMMTANMFRALARDTLPDVRGAGYDPENLPRVVRHPAASFYRAALRVADMLEGWRLVADPTAVMEQLRAATAGYCAGGQTENRDTVAGLMAETAAAQRAAAELRGKDNAKNVARLKGSTERRRRLGELIGAEIAAGREPRKILRALDDNRRAAVVELYRKDDATDFDVWRDLTGWDTAAYIRYKRDVAMLANRGDLISASLKI